MKLLTFYVIFFVVSVIAGCSNDKKLTEQEAKSLIIQTLKLPQSFVQTIRGEVGFDNSYVILEEQGYLRTSGSWLHGYSLHVTDKGKPFLNSSGKDNFSGQETLTFKTLDVDLSTITGISMDKNQKTATVRFNLIATNVTPVGRLLERSIDQPRNGELTFKKFDQGWQLLTEQNTSGISLVKRIFWNSNN